MRCSERTSEFSNLQGLDPCIMDDVGPARDLGLDPGGGFLGRSAHGLVALPAELFDQIGRLEHAFGTIIYLGDRRLRGSGRPPPPVPTPHTKSRQSAPHD